MEVVQLARGSSAMKAHILGSSESGQGGWARVNADLCSVNSCDRSIHGLVDWASLLGSVNSWMVPCEWWHDSSTSRLNSTIEAVARKFLCTWQSTFV